MSDVVFLQKPALLNNVTLQLPGSKSETNRLLLLRTIYPQIEILNASESDDSIAVRRALSSADNIIDIGHAGTAMRFLTAYFAAAEGRSVTLTGSPRMCQRPIQPLVDALRKLGANIEYAEATGFPPLRIVGQQLKDEKITVDSSMSSQFVSALILIAPLLKNGLELELTTVTSAPYIRMSLLHLEEIGIASEFSNYKIKIVPAPKTIGPKTIVVESDWSAASYYYSIVALSPPGFTLSLRSFKSSSRQGDAAVASLYRNFGVETTFEKDTILLTRQTFEPTDVNFNLSDTPDLAQTVAATCLGLGVGCILTGLHTLRIKETDRIAALQSEMQNLGAEVKIGTDFLQIPANSNLRENITIKTYDDHRMAMAFAPLAIRVPIKIENPQVVSKSYPTFWDDMKLLGFHIS
ncbi:MAG: 3-phosphoshikimate 1-carboxyvinyltransferase [Flavobacterium sp.]|nr:MAG: 3-phosphoshikimate 1-carboxyvinyltransferase [Flavobacterium sp.]